MIALILIAGHSTRMGQDKALIKRPDGLRQIDHLAAITRAAGLDPMLSMRDDGSAPPLDLPVIRDRQSGAGPLAALDAFHHAHPGEPVLLLGTDLFLLDEDTLRVVLEQRDPSRAATAFANRLDGHPEPLCTIFEAGSIPQASAWLARGEARARHFLRSLDPKIIDLPHLAAIDNINTLVDLDEAFAKLRQGVSEKTVVVFHSQPQFCGPLRTLACTLGGLFEEVRFQHRLPGSLDDYHPSCQELRAAWTSAVVDCERYAFVPKSLSPRNPD